MKILYFYFKNLNFDEYFSMLTNSDAKKKSTYRISDKIHSGWSNSTAQIRISNSTALIQISNSTA